MQISAQISQFHGVGIPFEVCEMPLAATPDTLLVRVSLATICGSDLHTVSGRRGAEIPCVLGHEVVGTVAAPTRLRSATGEMLREGDRITWSLHDFLWNMRLLCEFGTFHRNARRCSNTVTPGSEGADAFSGGFATHILLRPGTSIYHIPDTMTDQEAVPINCALATVVNGLANIGTHPGETAVIHGAGMLGIYATCYLQEKGYEGVVVVDTNESRLEIAKRFGATHTFNPNKTSVMEIDAALKKLNERAGS